MSYSCLSCFSWTILLIDSPDSRFLPLIPAKVLPCFEPNVVELSRHTGRDCRYPEHREVNVDCPPWPLGSGNPWRNDAVFRWHVDTSDLRSLAATGLDHGTRVRHGFDKSINTVAEHSAERRAKPYFNSIDTSPLAAILILATNRRSG